MTLPVFALLVLATAWLTKLVTDFAITLPFRMWVIRRFGETGKLAYLVHCYWCTATWWAVALTAITYLSAGHPIWVAILAALSVAFLAPVALAVVNRVESGSS